MSTTSKTPRLGRVEREDCPAEYQDDYDEVMRSRGQTTMANVFATLANSPGAMAVVCPVGAYVRYGTDFDNILRELVILTVANELRCKYEWGHHIEVAEKNGASEELLNKIGTKAIEAEPDPVGKTVRYARLVTRNEPVDDELADYLMDHFGKDGFVDLTVMIGYYGLLARFINTVGIPLEDGYKVLPFKEYA